MIAFLALWWPLLATVAITWAATWWWYWAVDGDLTITALFAVPFGLGTGGLFSIAVRKP